MIKAEIKNGTTKVEIGKKDDADVVLTELSCIAFDIINLISNNDNSKILENCELFVEGFIAISKQILREANENQNKSDYIVS